METEDFSFREKSRVSDILFFINLYGTAEFNDFDYLALYMISVFQVQ